MNILDNIMSLLTDEEDKLTDDEIESLKNKYPFLKLDKPTRTRLMEPFLKKEYSMGQIDWDFIETCYSLPERDYQSTAIMYLDHMYEFLLKDDIFKIEKLILTHSWWDTVYELSRSVGVLINKFPELKKEVILKWVHSDELWLNVAGILCQINLRENTDRVLLEKAIKENHQTSNFFVDKSIGQALVEYSKIDPEWVESFMEDTSLSVVSTREIKKFL